MITWADVVALDAQLASVPVAAQNLIISDCYLILDAGRWGSKLDVGARYLAAHSGALILKGGGLGAPGPVTEDHLGDASRSFAEPRIQRSLSDLDITPWGRRLQFLARGLGAWSVVSGSMTPITLPDDDPSWRI